MDLMADKLKIAYAGNLPYYDPKEVTGGLWPKIKSLFWDYRYYGVNNPLGKSPIHFFEILKRYKSVHSADHIEVNFWGSIAPKIKSMISEYDLDDMVAISGALPREDSLKRLRKHHLSLLTVAQGANGNAPFSIPGKTFDYFELGLPILALVEESHCAEVLRKSGLAEVIDPKKYDEAVPVLHKIYLNRDKLEDTYKPDLKYLSKFHYENLAKDYVDYLEQE